MELYPMTFTKKYIEKIWGGTKIQNYFSRTGLSEITGESWEIANVDGYKSIIDNGSMKGRDISQIHNESVMGKAIVDKYQRFPLIVKYIDANGNLSVQVHPKKDSEEQTKNEIWYFIDTPNDKRVICGLKKDYQIDNLGEYLDYVQVGKDTALFIPSGMVHALTKGSFILEIQESCDITYRLYDYDRIQSDGSLRELHVEKGKENIDDSINKKDCLCVEGQKHTVQGNDISLISESDFFTLEKWMLNNTYKTKSLEKSFSILNPLENDITINCYSGEYTFSAGESILIPALLGEYDVTGKGIVIHTYI